MDEQIIEGRPIGWISPPPGWLGNARAALSMRRGGMSRAPYDSLNLGRSVADDPETVRQNESLLLRALSLDHPPARLRLEHRAEIVTVNAAGCYGPADGIVTRSVGLPLWLTVADCLPVFLAAEGTIGLVHAGWRGVAAAVGSHALRRVEQLSGLPRDRIRVWVGPGIGPCCYTVGEEVASRFDREARIDREGQIYLDLVTALRRQLLEAGLPGEQFGASRLCTSCHPNRFYSFRRDGSRSGRMAAVLWLPT